MPFDLQAHRGGAGLWPENTLEAFGRALALGVSTLELDVHLTAEDDVVVAHDPALADARRIRELTRADLPATMPLLRQVAALLEDRGAAPVRVNLEIKYDALDAARLTSREAFVAKVVDALRIDGLVGRTSIQCFDWGVLDRVGEAEPALARNLLVSPKYLKPADDGPSTPTSSAPPRRRGSRRSPRSTARRSAPAWTTRRTSRSRRRRSSPTPTLPASPSSPTSSTTRPPCATWSARASTG